MNQEERALAVEQWPASQPTEQSLPVRCLQDAVQCVVGLRGSNTCRPPHKMQVMVAQHRGHPLPKTGGPPQHLERTGSTVHQVTDQPDTIGVGIEAEALEQTFQRVETASDVAGRDN